MFKDTIEEFFNAQRERLETSFDAKLVSQAYEALEAHSLDATGIDCACAQELCEVLKKKYDKEIGSRRLNGFGWTMAHIKDHMMRFLKTKLEESEQTIKDMLETSCTTQYARVHDDDSQETSFENSRQSGASRMASSLMELSMDT